jgi:Dyp-type peroxidase family
MQGLILSAYPHLDVAAYCLLRIDDPNLAKNWLANQIPLVTNASRNRRRDRCWNLNIAVAYSGLVKLGAALGLTPAAFSGFSDAFLEGVDGHPYRSRILGDMGKSDPVYWRWGGKGAQVDLLVMVFAQTDASLRARIATLFNGPTGTSDLTGTPLFARPLSNAQGHEHFGFADGISQPILRGTLDAERFPDSVHMTELGEVVLGYPDSLNNIATIPTLATPHDNFGTNGSYLVFRQLFQDVEAFWKSVADTAAAATGTSPNPKSPQAIELASKIVGRQPDGTPLVPYVNVDDNEFSFAGDPYGNGCPIGAHIRRANPRDSISMDLSQRPRNRHRVLRRARSYGAPADAGRGLLFLCLNADFERQFEFIHQNWINDPGFGGLAEELDPLVGARNRRGGGVFTIQGLPAPTRICGLPQFVFVRGGEYFFLPGINALRYLAGLPPLSESEEPCPLPGDTNG